MTVKYTHLLPLKFELGFFSPLPMLRPRLPGDALRRDAPEISCQPFFGTDQFGTNVKISGPHDGEPVVVEGSLAEGSALPTS